MQHFERSLHLLFRRFDILFDLFHFPDHIGKQAVAKTFQEKFRVG